MTIISSLLKYSRTPRRLPIHTAVVSTQIIKPSVRTPSHLKTHNLSFIDQYVSSVFIPLITFYPNTHMNSHDQIIRDLKNSLSRTLTKYYPFAGRHAETAPTYVECNDYGAEFVEANVDTMLAEFLEHSRHEDLDQFFPYGRVWRYSTHVDTVNPLSVKVSRFECGGVAIAVSLSHKVADGHGLVHFVNDWAKLTRNKKEHEVMVNDPHFLSFENINLNSRGFSLDVSEDIVTRSFVFPNAKLNELKLKVAAEHHIVNPTRVEVLTWLLYKCAVSAATRNNAGLFTPSRIGVSANIRNKMIEPLPEKCIGNFVMGLVVSTTNETELKPGFLIRELRKKKMEIQGVKDVEGLLKYASKISADFSLETKTNTYVCSSICGLPVNGIDFGWGTPVKVSLAGNLKKNSFILMDAPEDKGFQALVCLGKQEMHIVQEDPELLGFC